MKMTNEQAIEQLQKLIDFWELMMRVEENDDLQGTMLELEALRMAAQALKEKLRWIPCSEWLPEMHEKNDYTGWYEESNLVLICEKSGLHPQVHVGLCWKLEGRVGWRTREWKVLDKVVAWMPLPEVYSKEQIYTQQNERRTKQ